MAVSSGSSNFDEITAKLIKIAGCLRAKYRVAATTLMPLQCLGIHQKNRSGVFPQWHRSQNLMQNIFSVGFSKEVAWHQGVCVEELPQEKQPAGYVTLHNWNKDCSLRHPDLNNFVRNPDHVTHGTLSRSHLLLILKLLRNQQRSWPWPEKYKDLVMSNNGLDMSALQELDSDLADVLTQGLKMEVLSWKMMQEEPQGCSQISQALNMGNDIAMATSEATALAVLSDTVTFALKNAQLTQKAVRTVAYDAVRQSVAAELREFVDREGFVEMFDYVMNMGANTAPFIPALVDFTSVWVNSELKRLPLTAFREANRISNDFPRTKLAIVQRCYMQNPNSQGFVPVPEPCWAKVSKQNLNKLEQLLRYWDVEVRKSIASMETTIAQQLSANAAANAAAAFIKFVPISAAQKKGGDFEFEMMKATLTEYEQVIAHLQAPPPRPPADTDWIDYEAAQKHAREEEEKAQKEAEMRPPADKNVPLLAKCIQYDEEGKPMDEQDWKVKSEAEASIVDIPWSSWLGSTVGQDLDLDRSLTSAIHMALHSLHTSVSLVHAPVQFLLNETTKKITALATRDIGVNELQLPPCVPGAHSKLHKVPTKPNGIPIEIQECNVQMTAERKKRMTGKAPEGSNASTTIKTVTHTFYVYADTKLPAWESLLDNTAVAADRRYRRAMKPLDGKEVMHPFWLIPRCTEKDLRLRNEDLTGTQEATFNVELDSIQVGVVTTGCLMSQRTNIAWVVTVPIITNSQAIRKGEELFIKVTPPPKKEKEQVVETWKAAVKRSTKSEEGSGNPKKQKGTDKTTAAAETNHGRLSI